ncbi:MAG TPA: metal-sensitive transcriptional regulator [Candidatus Saccharimonadales bacterium]
MHYGYVNKKEQLTNRLKRVEGQVRGVARMIEEDTYCIDILTQISAIEAAMDKVALELLREHTRHCLANDTIGPKDHDEKVEEVIGAVGRLLAK